MDTFHLILVAIIIAVAIGNIFVGCRLYKDSKKRKELIEEERERQRIYEEMDSLDFTRHIRETLEN